MERLKKRLSKYGRLVSWALYLCPFCFQEVEKRIGNGERCNSCGCKTKELISKFMKGRFIGEKNPMYGKNKRKYFTEYFQNIMMGKVMECLL